MGPRIKSVYVKLHFRTYIVGTWIRYRFKYHASQITLHSTIQFLFQTPGLLNTFFDQVEFVVMKITYFFLQILVKEIYKKCKISQAYFLMPKKFVQFPVSDWIVRTIWQDWFITWLTFKFDAKQRGRVLLFSAVCSAEHLFLFVNDRLLISFHQTVTRCHCSYLTSTQRNTY